MTKVAACAVLLVTLLDRRPDGGVWAQPNRDPSVVQASDVDTLMWPIVQQINASGWVWTTESCQGHEGGYPMTLGVVTDDPGRFVAIVFAAHREAYGETSQENQNPYGWRIQLWQRPRVARGAYQIRLLPTGDREAALLVLRTVADRLLLTRP